MEKLPQVLFCVGIILLISVGIMGWTIAPLLMKKMIETELSLKKGSQLRTLWINPTDEIPVFLKVYIFNVTNPEEITEGKDPIVTEIGPYVYQEKRPKRIIEDNEEEDTITYAETFSFYFREELSNGREDDDITLLNMPFLAAAHQSANMPFFIKSVAAEYIKSYGDDLFVQRKVKEFLFTGTFIPMIHDIQSFTGDNLLPNSTFGLLYGKNNSEAAEMTIYTGVKDPSKVLQIKYWNKKKNLDYWGGPTCNMINGTDGTIFPSPLTKTSKVYLFAPDLCRSAYMEYTNEATVRGIDGYRFAIPKYAVEDPITNPDNACFCHEENLEDCPTTAIYSLKACRHGAPILASGARFFNADSSYSQKFGLKPATQEECESFGIVEPRTGLPIEVHSRVQINMDVKRNSMFPKLRKVQNLLFPVLWADETVTINEKYAAMFHYRVTIPVKIVDCLKWIFVAISFLFIIISIFMFILRSHKYSPIPNVVQ